MGASDARDVMRTVILSTDDHPDYVRCLPYVRKAWNRLGWRTLTFYLGQNLPSADDQNLVVEIQALAGYRSATLVQTARLLGHRYADGFIMTSDVDMMPLSDYWHPSADEVTCYGADLTGYKEYPICYIAADHSAWTRMIPEASLAELLATDHLAKSDVLREWWSTDQRIITKRIDEYKARGGRLRFIDRGERRYWLKGRLPIGRIDRAFWWGTKNSSDIKIDAHLPRPFDRAIVEGLLAKYHGF